MTTTSFESAIPVEMSSGQSQGYGPGAGTNTHSEEEEKVKNYIVTWRNQLRNNRLMKQNIWDECWQLYRGVEDWSDKEDWQTKIVIPKAFSSVKQATNVIKRLLSTAKKPFMVEGVNPDDLVMSQRANQMTDLTKAFMEKASYIEEFGEGLECGFVMGLGVWKIWWGLTPQTITKIEVNQVPNIAEQGLPGGYDDPSNITGAPPTAGDYITGEPTTPTTITGQDKFDYQRQDSELYPNQMGGEALNPNGWGGASAGGLGQAAPPSYARQIVRKNVLEGKLFIRAVDPYNFYWLPGSKFNRWTGTIEDVEIPKWQLMQMAKQGIFDMEKIKGLQTMDIPETNKRSWLRFNERPKQDQGPNSDTGTIKLTEFYGPVVIDGEILKDNAHVVIANDTCVLIYQDNPFWHDKAPYVAFSPLSLPFRADGVGLIEGVRAIDKALSRLANLSVDTLLFRLLPVFEVSPEIYENPEDLETGMTPGKVMRRNIQFAQMPGLTPVGFEDVSSGAMEVSAQLDRAHQEGALVSEIQQAIPRFRGATTATEIDTKQQNQDSFFGSMASDIEAMAIKPIVEMAADLIFQFIDTANDPRVAGILGIGADVLRGIPREQLMEMIQGDWQIKVSGITEQLEKADMLQNLVQLMNLIGQNPEAWLPYINQDALLRRILESFRPNIHDIEQIIADPAMVMANKLAMTHQQITPDLVNMIPQLAAQAHAVEQQKAENQHRQVDQGIQLAQMAAQHQQAQAQAAAKSQPKAA